MKKNQIVTFISSLLILLFFYAALSKLMDFSNFQFQLSRSPFITRFAKLTSWSLPLGEILVTAALVYAPTRLLGLFGGLFLMSLFTVYIYTMLHFSYYTPCSCGGVLSKMNWTVHLYFNISFVILSVIGIILYSPPPLREVVYRSGPSLA